MTDKTYASNLATAWSIERQDALFKRRVPDWPKSASRYKDELSAAKRKALDAAGLIERGDLVRATRRRDTVYVASLACLAVHEDDLTGILLTIGSRGGTVVVLDIDLTIPPGAITSEADAAVKAFRRSKRRAQTEGGRQIGAKVAAARREMASREKAEPFRERWNRRDDKTPDLLIEMDLTYNTAKKILGSRPEAQWKYELAQQQAERNRKRRKADK